MCCLYPNEMLGGGQQKKQKKQKLKTLILISLLSLNCKYISSHRGRFYEFLAIMPWPRSHISQICFFFILFFFIKHLYQPTFRDHSIPPLHSVSVVCCTAYQVDPPSWPCVAISTKQPHASISSSASISPSVTACLFIQLELFGDPRTPPDVCQCLREGGGAHQYPISTFFFSPNSQPLNGSMVLHKPCNPLCLGVLQIDIKRRVLW